MTDDEKISRRYRELGAEEPPQAIDDAILAAARRRPARWYAPLATAAVLVLAVAVALHTRVEQPGAESPAARPEKPAQPAAETVARVAPGQAVPKVVAPAKRAEPPGFAPDPKPAPQLQSQPQPAPLAAAGPAPKAASVGASGSLADAAGERAGRDMRADVSRERASAPAAAESMAKRMEAPAPSLADNPERELERIAGLRAQGRQDEADRALAEFRRRFPDYRIPEAMRERVERR